VAIAVAILLAWAGENWRVRDLYEAIIDQQIRGIKLLLGRHETVDLEFKRKEDSSHGAAMPSDLKRFGKILSAFSNSAGGLLVWGIEARPDPTTKIDHACTLCPISEIGRFKSDILRACSQVIIPRHDGIAVEAIAKQDTGAGYLLVYVERSERRPHRSEVDKLYYKRSGDSSIAMEHYDIEDSFKRIQTPILELGSSPILAG
jgi:predicted HTH transcriptional regulator